uniref:Cyclin Y like 1 n=1 Tax=Gorilla gorilla gorilla TaxID=9595 RepID=A0A2I2Z2K4_GORGO
MGNTLTCCVSPNASPKLGRRAGSAELYCASDIYEAVSGDAVAVAPTVVEPAELDFGEGEGHHLQHISDREMPEEKESHCVDQAGLELLAWAQAVLPPQPPE